jgi:hypothetical protein
MVSLVALAEQATGFSLAEPAEGAADGAFVAAGALAEAAPVLEAAVALAGAAVADAALVAAELVGPPADGVELEPPHAVRAVAATRATASAGRLLTSGRRRPGAGAAPRDRFIATSWSVGCSG